MSPSGKGQTTIAAANRILAVAATCLLLACDGPEAVDLAVGIDAGASPADVPASSTFAGTGGSFVGGFIGTGGTSSSGADPGTGGAAAGTDGGVGDAGATGGATRDGSGGSAGQSAEGEETDHGGAGGAMIPDGTGGLGGVMTGAGAGGGGSTGAGGTGSGGTGGGDRGGAGAGGGRRGRQGRQWRGRRVRGHRREGTVRGPLQRSDGRFIAPRIDFTRIRCHLPGGKGAPRWWKLRELPRSANLQGERRRHDVQHGQLEDHPALAKRRILFQASAGLHSYAYFSTF